MERAPGLVAGELGEVERLGDDPLARDGRVSVDQEREHAPSLLGIAADPLARPRLALDDGVDDFQVRRIGRKPHLDLVARCRREDRFISQVVLDVAVAAHGVGDVVLGELLKELVEGLAHHAAEHVEPAPVGHSHHDLLDARLRAVVDHRVKRGDDRLAALKREPLLPDILCVEEFLEQLRLVHPPKDPDLLGPRERRLKLGRFDPFLKPETAVLVLDMGVFDPHMTAVGLLKGLDDVAKLHLPPAQVRHEVERCLQVVVTQLKLAERELRQPLGRSPKRIQVGLEVADRPVGENKIADPRLLRTVDDRRLLQVPGEQFGGRRAVVSEREALEECPPGRVDPVGVVEPQAVHRLDHVEVCAGWKGRRIHHMCRRGTAPAFGREGFGDTLHAHPFNSSPRGRLGAGCNRASQGAGLH
jgi:hypothetical protein